MSYVRQQAWLSTVPDEPVQGQKQKLPSLTHFQILEKKFDGTDWFSKFTETTTVPIEVGLWSGSFSGIDEGEPELPFVLSHIWFHLLEVGPVSHGGMGSVPLSFLEIQAWMHTTCMHLSPWEVLLLRRCSQEWQSAQYEAKQPNSIPPWNTQTTEERRQSVSDRLKNALGGGR